MAEMSARGRMLLVFLVARFQERGTWAHLLNLLATATGVRLAPQLAELIAFGGMTIAAIIGILTVEAPPRVGGFDAGPGLMLPPAANDHAPIPEEQPFDPGAGR